MSDDIEKQLACREKVWTERNVDEKLTALREELLSLHHRVAGYDSLVRDLMRHQHGAQGQLVTPLVEGHDPFGHSREPISLRLKP